ANTAPEWESRFGDAARQARALQIIDPGAPGRGGDAGLADGKAVAGAQKAYAKSYGYAVEEPKQSALPVISTTGAR
ncbi:MAG: hypothetical protein H0W48_01620, partial [Methylibium sp.]|nr:hypothetical protein [Methylibium sp.]